MQTLVHIHLLGMPHILSGNARVSEFPTEKVRLLSFYLLLFRHHEHTRSSLACLFWGDSSERQARRALCTALWRLRQWLKPIEAKSMPLVCLEDQGIAFNALSACWVDVAKFEEQIATHSGIGVPPPAGLRKRWRQWMQALLPKRKR